MRHNQLEQLLTLIVAYDRKPFPDGATEAWLPLLHEVTYADAEQAVHRYYGAPSARDDRGNLRQILPGDVRAGARYIREARERSSTAGRRTLTAPPERRGSTGRPGHVEALLAKNRAKVAEAEAKYRSSLQTA